MSDHVNACFVAWMFCIDGQQSAKLGVSVYSTFTSHLLGISLTRGRSLLTMETTLAAITQTSFCKICLRHIKHVHHGNKKGARSSFAHFSGSVWMINAFLSVGKKWLCWSLFPVVAGVLSRLHLVFLSDLFSRFLLLNQPAGSLVTRHSEALLCVKWKTGRSGFY